MRPVIALLSDFGTRDHYAGTMKGVMIGICPDVTLVDITHDITPHDVMEGALQLAASCRYFPAGTIFLAIVDPGVGSSRRGIAVEAGDYRFVAPDNGVLTAALPRPPAQAGRRTDRAAIRATDREPHVRRARSVCSGRRVAGKGHSAVSPRPHRHDLSPDRHSAAEVGEPTRWGRAPRRSLRQSGHQHRSTHVRIVHARATGAL